jgi:hypothetical protein
MDKEVTKKIKEEKGKGGEEKRAKQMVAALNVVDRVV